MGVFAIRPITRVFLPFIPLRGYFCRSPMATERGFLPQYWSYDKTSVSKWHAGTAGEGTGVSKYSVNSCPELH